MRFIQTSKTKELQQFDVVCACQVKNGRCLAGEFIASLLHLYLSFYHEEAIVVLQQPRLEITGHLITSPRLENFD